VTVANHRLRKTWTLTIMLLSSSTPMVTVELCGRAGNRMLGARLNLGLAGEALREGRIAPAAGAHGTQLVDGLRQRQQLQDLHTDTLTVYFLMLSPQRTLACRFYYKSRQPKPHQG